MLRADWRENDLFQAVLVVAVLRRLDPDATLIRMNAQYRTRFSASVGSLIACRPQRRAGRQQPLSAYLRFWMAYASTLLLNSDDDAAPLLSSVLPEDALPIGASVGVRMTLERACELAYDDVCRQIAFHAAGDTINQDVRTSCACIELHGRWRASCACIELHGRWRASCCTVVYHTLPTHLPPSQQSTNALPSPLPLRGGSRRRRWSFWRTRSSRTC